VRILNAFRARLGVMGLRQINEAILQPLIQTAALWQNATALIDATDGTVFELLAGQRLPAPVRLRTCRSRNLAGAVAAQHAGRPAIVATSPSLD
jgi:hypothetical protein